MTDMYDPTVPPVDDRTPPTEPGPVVEVPVDHVAEPTPVDEGHDEVNGVWRAEAGRQGGQARPPAHPGRQAVRGRARP